MCKHIYVHTENVHNLNAPRLIVPVLCSVLKPRSVIDVGCGTGTFLHEFKKQGVNDVLGIDGSWVDKELLKKYINPEHFIESDLENGIRLERVFDLALCLEVAEHLKEESAEILVESLTTLSDNILFSAALPGQGGQNHLNEQWPEYWISKFKTRGFEFHDVMRPIFWKQKEIEWWYRQNMFLVVKKGIEYKMNDFSVLFGRDIRTYIHPELFMLKIEESRNDELRTIKEIREGRVSARFYLEAIGKKIFRKLGLKGSR